MRKGAKGTLDDQSAEGREMTFADFLSGQTDVSYLVHPHANPMGKNLLSRRDNIKKAVKADTGFGSGNLDVLE